MLPAVNCVRALLSSRGAVYAKAPTPHHCCGCRRYVRNALSRFELDSQQYAGSAETAVSLSMGLPVSDRELSVQPPPGHCDGGSADQCIRCDPGSRFCNPYAAPLDRWHMYRAAFSAHRSTER